MFTGNLRTDKQTDGTVLLKFYNDGTFTIPGVGDITFTEKVTLNRGAGGSSGSGSTLTTDSDPMSGSSSEAFDIAYDGNYFYRSDGTADVCLSRSSPDTTVWRYGLYYDENHSTDPGGAVTISSGFPVKYTQSGTDYHGWVGFHGLWFPDGVTPANGDTVYKQTYSSTGTSETAYTIFIARGKLIKHTRKAVTLADIASVPLSYQDCTDLGGGSWSCVDTRVEWNSTTGKLMKNATRSSSSNWAWQDITPAEVTFNAGDWDFSFYSESLGGSGRVNLMDPATGSQITLANSTQVVFHL